MRRGIHALGLVALAALAGCPRSSDGQGMVTAPVASGSAALDAEAPPVPSASSSAALPGAPPASGDQAPPELAACRGDADCVAVPRVGCCHNGWMAAVNASQVDAYAHSFTCAEKVMCPMYVVRDTRVARCDVASHLCVMTKPAP
jgi:hypothetical protein